MKKTYLAPAIKEHKLRIESYLLANSPIKGVNVGNKAETHQGEGQSVIEDFHQGTIGSYEGDDISNI